MTSLSPTVKLGDKEAISSVSCYHSEDAASLKWCTYANLCTDFTLSINVIYHCPYGQTIFHINIPKFELWKKEFVKDSQMKQMNTMAPDL
jgi:hypothetical protein